MKDYPDKMNPEQARAFRDDVFNIVSQIPPGRVTTYGHIAVLAGWPSHSRMVGRTLRYTPGAEQLPCHRVVNKAGRTAPGWSRQRPLLEEEGVTFKANGHVDMDRHLWNPSDFEPFLPLGKSRSFDGKKPFFRWEKAVLSMGKSRSFSKG